MTLRIEIDRGRCMGSGNCVYWAPNVFDLDEEELAVAVGDVAADEERVRLAVEHCPTRSITIRER